MNIIVVTTLAITVIGAVVGTGLVFTGKKFHVETDQRETDIREVLPGNNCGACGYAGCDAMAAAMVAGDAPANGCPVGGAAVAEKVAAILGTTAGPVAQNVAFIRCSGTCQVTKNRGNYIGIPDCRSVVLAGLNLTDCNYGCLGLGSCAAVCPQGAITIRNGVAAVDRARCVGCGLCAKACPKGLIELIPAEQFVAVRCANRDRGPQVKQVCAAGCIGCGICAKQCEAGAVTVEANLAHVDYAACVQCGKCAVKCPSKVIASPAEQPVR